ncbi:uncharacterized protein LOC124622660 isoform X1 [Schistocerca americana]|uniref:uncharacterized protein LOC124622660 isoform X1 n=1 Tax=Schistocerca americana TaxID=7009 RepID=UPI001F4F1BB2|nr:uncharacterized protein LOC124622660 isoform X1 [Schistocerca americana]
MLAPSAVTYLLAQGTLLFLIAHPGLTLRWPIPFLHRPLSKFRELRTNKNVSVAFTLSKNSHFVELPGKTSSPPNVTAGLQTTEIQQNKLPGSGSGDVTDGSVNNTQPGADGPPGAPPPPNTTATNATRRKRRGLMDIAGSAVELAKSGPGVQGEMVGAVLEMAGSLAGDKVRYLAESGGEKLSGVAGPVGLLTGKTLSAAGSVAAKAFEVAGSGGGTVVRKLGSAAEKVNQLLGLG